MANRWAGVGEAGVLMEVITPQTGTVSRFHRHNQRKCPALWRAWKGNTVSSTSFALFLTAFQHLYYNSIVHIKADYDCAQVVFPPQCLALPGQEVWRRGDGSLEGDRRTKGSSWWKHGCKRRTTNQTNATERSITETTGEDLKESI